jgi:primosomal replication protein N
LFVGGSPPVNRLCLLAVLAQVAAPRYTPAGIPVIDVWFEHTSEQQEAGQVRKVSLQLKGVAFGTVSESLSRQPLGTTLEASGFLTNTRNGKGVVFHIQDFKPI